MKKNILFVCIALVAGIIIGVLLCFFLRPFAEETSTQDTKEPAATAKFADKTLVGKYQAVSEDMKGTTFELKEDGSIDTGNDSTGTWKRMGDFVQISIAYYSDSHSNDGNPEYCEYEYLAYVVEDGLILDDRLYAKQ